MVSTDYGLTWEDFGLNEYEVVRMIYESYSLLAATRNNGYFAKYHSQGDWLPFSAGLGEGKVINDALNYTTWVLHTATANHSVYFLWLIINDVEDQNDLKSPNNFVLMQNYPNPFNPSTRIQYKISNTQFVVIKIYDAIGNEIAKLVNEEKSAGIYEADFNADKYGLTSGIYFYQLQTGNFVETKKMILLR
uniref:T9SS type A sorting domain-containing protein n=1 Tax=Ignavibacterium album TaxID=591197 RepID=A0A7V2ZKK2_9BACT